MLFVKDPLQLTPFRGLIIIGLPMMAVASSFLYPQ
jgi:hypothetical protein